MTPVPAAAARNIRNAAVRTHKTSESSAEGMLPFSRGFLCADSGSGSYILSGTEGVEEADSVLLRGFAEEEKELFSRPLLKFLERKIEKKLYF